MTMGERKSTQIVNFNHEENSAVGITSIAWCVPISLFEFDAY